MAIKLVCLDMDGVLTQDKNFWMRLHEAYGTLEEGKVVTKQWLHVDYHRLIREVVQRLWMNKDEKTYVRAIGAVPLTHGLQDFFVALDNLKDPITDERVPRAIISSGPRELAERITAMHPVDHIFANRLVFRDGKVSGEFDWPVGAGTHAKARIIEELCAKLGISAQEVLYIGDSPSDVVPFKLVGTSIAFNNPPRELIQVATYVIATNDLRHVIPLIERLERQQ